MKEFMDQDFLLSNETGKMLFHQYAKKCPIIDYHCHVDPREIYEDLAYDNITQMWLSGDHYKWRLMRWCGVPEHYITGEASDYEKFYKWAQTIEKAIGNPLYHWSHLELQRYFGFTEHLCSSNIDKAWEHCNQKIAQEHMSARSIIRQSHVKLLCTTDDPLDSLVWHKKLLEDNSFDIQVLPAWRPDGILEINSSEFSNYINKLASVCDCNINSLEEMLKAVEMRMDFFAEAGCTIADHGLDYVMYSPCSDQEAESIFLSGMEAQELSPLQVRQYQTKVMLTLGEAYQRRNWVMQLHYNCKRNNNQKQRIATGINTGFDCMNNEAPAASLTTFLDELCKNDHLPKTILYSLNSNDNALIDTIIGCYQDDSLNIGKMQHGSAWWFNDHETGMREHLTSLANLGMLSNFIGMLTDSRSFLSYVRHEYFRRILCDMVGEWVEKGRFPNDQRILAEIIRGISFNNAIDYFNFNLSKVI